MSKANQNVLMMVVLGIAVGGLALKYGRNLPVIADVAEGYGA